MYHHVISWYLLISCQYDVIFNYIRCHFGQCSMQIKLPESACSITCTWRVKQIRQLLGHSVAAISVCVPSRLDYCNTVLSCLPLSTITLLHLHSLVAWIEPCVHIISRLRHLPLADCFTMDHLQSLYTYYQRHQSRLKSGVFFLFFSLISSPYSPFPPFFRFFPLFLHPLSSRPFLRGLREHCKLPARPGQSPSQNRIFCILF